MFNFKDISYLQKGNLRQQKAYSSLMELQLFEKLKTCHPTLTGTIPIGIDVDSSDLDVICFCKDLNQFEKTVTNYFGTNSNFEIQEKTIRNQRTIVARFNFKNFLIEIFGQNRPVEEQEAYRHMLIEWEILEQKGEQFKNQIIELKKQGFKTEPAFAKLLGLEGDPYAGLLNYRL